MGEIDADGEYTELVQQILQFGVNRDDRTGTGTLSLFAPPQLRFDLREGFPLLTTKFVSFRTIIVELCWMLIGETNISYLHKYDVHIWDEWADENGDLGLIYGAQWRWRNGMDQVGNVIEHIKENPMSRRHIVSAWVPADIEHMRLPACHCFFQFYVDNGTLSAQVYQRSADVFLGLPFNIASYAALTHWVAKATGLTPAHLVYCLGDAHIYNNHIDVIQEQISRKPFDSPRLEITEFFDPPDPSHFVLHDYRSHGRLRGAVSV